MEGIEGNQEWNNTIPSESILLKEKLNKSFHFENLLNIRHIFLLQVSCKNSCVQFNAFLNEIAYLFFLPKGGVPKRMC